MGSDWAQLKVVELKEELKARGLPVSGKKAELVARLEEAEASAEGEAAPVEPAAADGAADTAAVEDSKPAEASAQRDSTEAEAPTEANELAEPTAQRDKDETAPIANKTKSEGPTAPVAASAEAEPEKPTAAAPTSTEQLVVSPAAAAAAPTSVEVDSPGPAVGQRAPPPIPAPAAPFDSQPTVSSVPSQQAVLLHKSETAVPAVSSGPRQPELASAPSTQAVILGNRSGEPGRASQAAGQATSSLDTVMAPLEVGPPPAQQPATSDTSAPSTAISVAADVPMRAALADQHARDFSPAPAAAQHVLQAPAVGTPDPTNSHAPLKRSMDSPTTALPALTASGVRPASPDTVRVPTDPSPPAQAALAVEVEASALRQARTEAQQRRPPTPPQQQVPVDRKRDREGSSKPDEQQPKAKALKSTPSADAPGKLASKRAPIPMYIRKEPQRTSSSAASEAAAGAGTGAGAAAGAAAGKPPVPVVKPQAAPEAAKTPPLTSQSSADKRVSVFAGRLSGSVKEEGGGTPKAPPSRQEASRALLIDGFKRPFTDKAAREMLGQTGTVVGLKFGPNKKMAYVIMESVEEAQATRDATWSLEWPPDNKGSLRPKFIPESEAQEFIGSDAAVPAAAANGSAHDALQPSEQPKVAAKKRPVPQDIFPPDLFNLTDTQPSLYWRQRKEEDIQTRWPEFKKQRALKTAAAEAAEGRAPDGVTG